MFLIIERIDYQIQCGFVIRAILPIIYQTQKCLY